MHKLITYILVESTKKGSDKRFLAKLIKERSLLAGKDFEIKTQDLMEKDCSVGGVLNYLDYLSGGKDKIITTGRLNNLLLIIDADENMGERFKKIKQIIKSNGQIFSIPSRLGVVEKSENKINFGVYLFPDNKNNGSLEGLILGCVKPRFISKNNCAEEYFHCLTRSGVEEKMTINNVSKAKIRIIGSTPDPDNYIQNLINIVDFKSNKLDCLVNFLNQVD